MTMILQMQVWCLSRAISTAGQTIDPLKRVFGTRCIAFFMPAVFGSYTTAFFKNTLGFNKCFFSWGWTKQD